MCVSVCVDVPQGTCVHKRKPFFHVTIWILEIELCLSGLEANPFPSWAISLAHGQVFCIYHPCSWFCWLDPGPYSSVMSFSWFLCLSIKILQWIITFYIVAYSSVIFLNFLKLFWCVNMMCVLVDVCTCMQMCLHEFGDQRLMISFFFNFFMVFLLRQSPSLNLELSWLG